MSKKVLFCATVDYHFKAFHLPYLKWFKEQGWEVHVAAQGQLDLPFVDQKYDIPIQRSPFRRKNIQAYSLLRELMNTQQYELVHCHTPMGGVLARLAARGARTRGTKVVYTAHGFHFCKGSPLSNWILYYPIEKGLSRYTDCLITINREDYELARTHRFGARQIVHVHGVGVDPERFQPLEESERQSRRLALGYQMDEFLLIYAAEFNKNKNQQMLLHALGLIHKEIPQVKLLLAGEGVLLEQCKALTQRLGIENNVEFLGFRNDLDQLLPLCDVGVASSLREGLPVNMMEAMACGLPVIASDNRGHRELVRSGVNGFIIAPQDIQSFAKHLVTLYQSPEMRNQMSLESIQRAKDYSVSRVATELNQIYMNFMLRDEDETKNKYHRAHL